MKIGVLAVQGAFVEHISIWQQLGAEAPPVRLPNQLDSKVEIERSVSCSELKSR
jgi:glutamine amidotransferase PdxT